MTTPQDDPRLRVPWLGARLVAAAVLVTSIIYLVVCILIAEFLPTDGTFTGFVFSEGETPPEVFDLARILLMAISLPMIGFAFFMRGIIKRRGPAPLGSGANSAFAPRGPMAPPDTREGRALDRLVQATLVSMAFAETPGIFGLVMFLVRGGFAWLGAFLAISFAAKLALFPRWSEVKEMVEGERLKKDF